MISGANSELPWEDALLERKVESDLKDLLKTVVAFANSVRPGHTAVILIGEKDDGSAQGVTNPDNIQKTVRETCEKVYPDIVWSSMVYEKEGKFCVRVEIQNCGNTPHFGGPAWVRRGSSTIRASEETFQNLIDIRSDPVFELAKWINKKITIHMDFAEFPIESRQGIIRWPEEKEVVLRSVNRYWITVEDPLWLIQPGNPATQMVSEPIEKLILTYDNKNQRLKVLVKW
jgi:hypothetical protein